MKKSLLFFCILFMQIRANTLVYNMRIRRIFSLGDHSSNSSLNQKKSKSLISVVPITYKRKRHIVDMQRNIDVFEKRKTNGAILNFRFIQDRKWWLEVTTGIEKEKACYIGSNNFKAHRTGLDDIVFSGGYVFKPHKDTQFVLYGLFGIPTKKNVTILEIHEPLVGTRFKSLGIGSELSYSFINKIEESLIFIFQNRFVHFFNRDWFPILPKGSKIQPGNITDLLFTIQYRRLKNSFEMGYNPTFFTNQGVIVQNQKTLTETFIRQSVYFSYLHLFKKFPIIKQPGALGTGLSISRSKRFETKIFIWWVNFSLLF